jgi:hypothetical protein
MALCRGSASRLPRPAALAKRATAVNLGCTDTAHEIEAMECLGAACLFSDPQFLVPARARGDFRNCPLDEGTDMVHRVRNPLNWSRTFCKA